MTKLRGWAMICKFALMLPTLSNTQHWGSDTDAGDACVNQLYNKFVNPLSEEWSPERRCVPLTSWYAFLRWSREETALAAADGCLQGDCSLTLQTGTTWYYNNKGTLSQSETPLGGSENINNAERLRAAGWRPLGSGSLSNTANGRESV